MKVPGGCSADSLLKVGQLRQIFKNFTQVDFHCLGYMGVVLHLFFSG
jgi:hypothetical protein